MGVPKLLRCFVICCVVQVCQIVNLVSSILKKFHEFLALLNIHGKQLHKLGSLTEDSTIAHSVSNLTTNVVRRTLKPMPGSTSVKADNAKLVRFSSLAQFNIGDGFCFYKVLLPSILRFMS